MAKNVTLPLSTYDLVTDPKGTVYRVAAVHTTLCTLVDQTSGSWTTAQISTVKNWAIN